MNRNLRITLLLIDIIAFATIAIWYYQTRDLEALACLIGAFGGLIALIFTKDKPSNPIPPSIRQKQRGGKDSTNVQAGGDINL